MRRLATEGRASAGGRATAVALVLLAAVAIDPTTAYAQSYTPLTALQTERVERFLEQRVACRGCHVIAGRGGAIGPILDGISERADFDHVLAVIQDPSILPGSIMPHQVMAPAQATRLARHIYAQPLPGQGSTEDAARAPVSLSPGQENDGAALYARHCAACHGETGGGDGWNAPRLPVPPTVHADAELMGRRPDDTLYDGIAAGGYVLDRSSRMPPFSELLSHVQIRALVAHIRTLCSCSQPAWAGGGR